MNAAMEQKEAEVVRLRADKDDIASHLWNLSDKLKCMDEAGRGERRRADDTATALQQVSIDLEEARTAVIASEQTAAERALELESAQLQAREAEAGRRAAEEALALVSEESTVQAAEVQRLGEALGNSTAAQESAEEVARQGEAQAAEALDRERVLAAELTAALEAQQGVNGLHEALSTTGAELERSHVALASVQEERRQLSHEITVGRLEVARLTTEVQKAALVGTEAEKEAAAAIHESNVLRMSVLELERGKDAVATTLEDVQAARAESADQ